MQKRGRAFTLMMATLLAIAIIGCGGDDNGNPLLVSDGKVTRITGSGNMVSETRDVNGFTAVSLKAIGRLRIEHGAEESLTITAEDNILPHLISEVRGDELILGPKDFTNFQTVREMTYTVTVKTLDAIEVSGAGSVDAKGIDTDQLSVTASGAGHMTVAGKVNRQDVTISGAGNYDAENLESKEAEIGVSGTAQAVVKVSDRLSVQISDVGSVEYIGSPKIAQSVSGLGSLRQR